VGNNIRMKRRCRKSIQKGEQRTNKIKEKMGRSVGRKGELDAGRLNMKGERRKNNE
jgi:hypothetical protein